MNDANEGALLGLPESQTELDVSCSDKNIEMLKILEIITFLFQNLTEYNTAHNRRISMLGITDDNIRKASTLLSLV